MAGRNFLAGLLGGVGKGGSQGLQNMQAIRMALIAAGQMGLIEEPMFKGRQRVPGGFAGEIAPAPEYEGERYQRYRQPTEPGGARELESMFGMAPGMEEIPGAGGEWGMPAGTRTRLGPIGADVGTQLKEQKLEWGKTEPDRWAVQQAHKIAAAAATAGSKDAMGMPVEGEYDKIYNETYTATYDKLKTLAGITALGEEGVPGEEEGEAAEGGLFAGAGEFGPNEMQSIEEDVAEIMGAPAEAREHLLTLIGDDPYAVEVKRRVREQTMAEIEAQRGVNVPGAGGGVPARGFVQEGRMLRDFIMPPYGRQGR